MKNILITILISIIALTNVQAKDKSSIEACKTYINEAKSFQSTMKSDKISEATFAFYKDNVVAHCGNIAAKMPYKKDFFALQLMKKDRATVNNCKTAIKMAHTYDNKADKIAFISNAHKINITDNCGTLVAKKAPAFCLFDKIDNSKEKLKEKCLTSIEKAHATMGTSADFENKGEVLRNCGRLHATI